MLLYVQVSHVEIGYPVYISPRDVRGENTLNPNEINIWPQQYMEKFRK
jgi:hypothetical protein